MDQYSIYYQAKVQQELCWMVTSTMRYSDHVAFDRTIDKENSIFEFFVSPDLEDVFLDIASKLQAQGVILELTKMDNRLKYENFV